MVVGWDSIGGYAEEELAADMVFPTVFKETSHLI